MDSVSSGTLGGAGSFRCQRCGYVLTLAGSDRLTDCPGCGGREFVRASLFSTERIHGAATGVSEGTLSEPAPADSAQQLAKARERIEQPGEYLCYEESGEFRTVALTREWTRIGRSLAADVRFDDPTVSRRHALIVRQPDGVRVLDDRSLNGVFVNGARVEGRVLKDGDEIIVGRYRLSFLSVPLHAGAPAESPDQRSLHVTD
jgi:pSer/pThr/pTyr-binding forkhead associated (FHA) protein/DNA-directed RNA polymerase subunit RPC12/RpoP